MLFVGMEWVEWVGGGGTPVIYYFVKRMTASQAALSGVNGGMSAWRQS